MFKIGVFALLFDSEQRVLLSHRKDYDLWNLPGGGLEEGETPWEGVVRETKEETGLDVEVLRLVGVYAKPTKQELVFAFLCQTIGGQLRLSDEADRHQYFNVDSLPANTIPKQVERIRDALEGKEEVILKTQAGQSSLDLLKQGKL